MIVSQVTERKLSPDELTAELERLKRFDPPRAKRWEPTMTREEYFDARVAGRTREDIILKCFNNESDKLAKQLKEWGFPTWKAEMVEVEELAKGQKHELTITKEEYLQRRLAGEGRSKIIKSLGGATGKAYKLLESWGIREMDAEERVLELLAPAKPVNEVDRRVAEQLAHKAEAREAAVADQPEVEAAAQDVAARIIEQEVDLTQGKDAEIERLNAEIEGRDCTMEQLREEVSNLTCALEAEQKETKRLMDALNGAAVAADQAGRHIRSLEEERLVLVRTIEAAAGDDADGYVTLRLPILPASVANVERLHIYNAVESFGQAIEAAGFDRERVLRELMTLNQRVVNFVTADLAELLPGQDVSVHVQRFFRAHNDRHVESVMATALQEAG